MSAADQATDEVSSAAPPRLSESSVRKHTSRHKPAKPIVGAWSCTSMTGPADTTRDSQPRDMYSEALLPWLHASHAFANTDVGSKSLDEAAARPLPPLSMAMPLGLGRPTTSSTADVPSHTASSSHIGLRRARTTAERPTASPPMRMSQDMSMLGAALNAPETSFRVPSIHELRINKAAAPSHDARFVSGASFVMSPDTAKHFDTATPPPPIMRPRFPSAQGPIVYETHTWTVDRPRAGTSPLSTEADFSPPESWASANMDSADPSKFPHAAALWARLPDTYTFSPPLQPIHIVRGSPPTWASTSPHMTTSSTLQSPDLPTTTHGRRVEPHVPTTDGPVPYSNEERPVYMCAAPCSEWPGDVSSPSDGGHDTTLIDWSDQQKVSSVDQLLLKQSWSPLPVSDTNTTSWTAPLDLGEHASALGLHASNEPCNTPPEPVRRRSSRKAPPSSLPLPPKVRTADASDAASPQREFYGSAGGDDSNASPVDDGAPPWIPSHDSEADALRAPHTGTVEAPPLEVDAPPLMPALQYTLPFKLSSRRRYQPRNTWPSRPPTSPPVAPRVPRPTVSDERDEDLVTVGTTRPSARSIPLAPPSTTGYGVVQPALDPELCGPVHSVEGRRVEDDAGQTSHLSMLGAVADQSQGFHFETYFEASLQRIRDEMGRTSTAPLAGAVPLQRPTENDLFLNAPPINVRSLGSPVMALDEFSYVVDNDGAALLRTSTRPPLDVSKQVPELPPVDMYLPEEHEVMGDAPRSSYDQRWTFPNLESPLIGERSEPMPADAKLPLEFITKPNSVLSRGRPVKKTHPSMFYASLPQSRRYRYRVAEAGPTSMLQDDEPAQDEEDVDDDPFSQSMMAPHTPAKPTVPSKAASPPAAPKATLLGDYAAPRPKPATRPKEAPRQAPPRSVPPPRSMSPPPTSSLGSATVRMARDAPPPAPPPSAPLPPSPSPPARESDEKKAPGKDADKKFSTWLKRMVHAQGKESSPERAASSSPPAAAAGPASERGSATGGASPRTSTSTTQTHKYGRRIKRPGFEPTQPGKYHLAGTVSLPTLNVARTAEQRARDETGLPETEPALIQSLLAAPSSSTVRARAGIINSIPFVEEAVPPGQVLVAEERKVLVRPVM